MGRGLVVPYHFERRLRNLFSSIWEGRVKGIIPWLPSPRPLPTPPEAAGGW